MDRLNLVRTVALTLMTAAVTAACDGGSGSSASECRVFRTALSVEDRMSQVAGVFNPGEPITFELQIANTSVIQATLTAASSCTAVVFEVFDASEQRQWGSADGIEWLPYEFKFKAGDLSRPPGWVAPYHPRLDWQMWFAALGGSCDQSPWLEPLFPRQ